MSTIVPGPVDGVRSVAEPMAFTRTEFLGGAARAWAITTLLVAVAWTLAGGGELMVPLMFVLPSSVFALAGGSPVAYLLGRALRHHAGFARHVTAFAAFSVALGVATTTAFIALFDVWESAWTVGMIYLINVPLTGVGVASAWWRTARLALSIDTESDDIDTRSLRPAATPETHDVGDGYRVIDPRQRPPRG